MQASNRSIDEWFGKIKRGEITLPRFQRHEAWDWRRISSLMNTITQNLPLGITLVLQVGEQEQFVSRYLATAPETNQKVMEQLLDGQQRLTSLWRVLFNNYEWHTYFVYVPEFDSYDQRISEEQTIFCRSRYYMKNKHRYPLWCDDPVECLKRGMIPTSLLRPEDIQEEINRWLNQATEWKKPDNPAELENFYNWKKEVSDKILELRSTVKNYNLPYLSLPTSTDKAVALEVFINMNTNSKPLSHYDVIVAEIENTKGQSLHDLQEDLNLKYPEVQNYYDLSYLILNTSALLQEKLPSQRGLWEMDKSIMVDKWEQMELGLNEMAIFLDNEGIIDRDRLPTNAVLAVIAALFPFIPEKGDERGVCEILLRKYLWSSFFTDRYENSAASRAYADYMALKRIVTKQLNDKGVLYKDIDVPVFNRQLHPLVPDELKTATWPKRDTIRGRATLAIACRLGACDFATGHKVDKSNINKRHYHHIFPTALLEEAEIDGFLALNCALITDNTNLNIGRKDPLKYLKDRYAWVSEDIVNERLNSHLIPINELANGGYDRFTDEARKQKIANDFDAFLTKRSLYMTYAAEQLVGGRSISSSEIIRHIV